MPVQKRFNLWLLCYNSHPKEQFLKYVPSRNCNASSIFSVFWKGKLHSAKKLGNHDTDDI